MKERPIIFNGEMVRAILEGRKTQTRRVVKAGYRWPIRSLSKVTHEEHLADMMAVADMCPYGQAGDRLWVRETWCQDGRGGKESNGEDTVYYRADFPDPSVWKGFWKPSIYMPRWASRITLEVKSVRVERVQDISEEDAKAEGVTISGGCPHWVPTYYDPDSGGCCTYKCAFEHLWDSINEKRGYGWDTNPYCWVVEFRRV